MISIAIDGPSGAGKSSVAKCLAKKLNYVNVDTGALYRCIAYYFFKNEIDCSCEKNVLKNLKNININVKYNQNNQIVFLNGENVTNEIRSDKISMLSSKLSSMSCVRKYLLSLQRNIASVNNVVMDGRDIGTVVLPNADIKIFLTASPECRAKRRFAQLSGSFSGSTFSEVLKNINERDFNDTHRKVAPLKIAQNAVIFDNSDCTFEETIEYLLTIIRERVNLETK